METQEKTKTRSNHTCAIFCYPPSYQNTSIPFGSNTRLNEQHSAARIQLINNPSIPSVYSRVARSSRLIKTRPKRWAWSFEVPGENVPDCDCRNCVQMP